MIICKTLNIETEDEGIITVQVSCNNKGTTEAVVEQVWEQIRDALIGDLNALTVKWPS